MNKTSDKKVELLIPAGSLEVLKVAVDYGADAVYIGGEQYGLRAMAHNFSIEEMIEGANYCHEHGAKLHVTINIFAHNEDLEGIRAYMEKIKDVPVDALIISDPAIFTMAGEILPNVERHVSTQANNTNYGIYKFWYGLGAKRVVSARELSLKEIREIRENIPDAMEIESFIHGAMCISYSGRCLLSNFLTGRDANQGACTHPCRWQYSVVEEKRPGEYFPVEEDDRGTYIFNSKDLCMIEHIPDMINAGIDSFKIEGRMKTALYVATVARTYRKAIDDFYKDEELYKSNLPYYMEEIGKCTYRQYTTGFYYGKPSSDAQVYDNNEYVKNYIYVGKVESVDANGCVCFMQRNKFCVGQTVEAMAFDGNNQQLEVKAIYNENGESVESAPHPKEQLKVDLGAVLPVGTIIRMRAV
ncbi:MAG: U32 family peptidase [Lachnospiraceae bacterium]|jgi:putative protease|nr:U32 family peptidase [Lachnospiraceae bacterium]